MCRSGGSRRWPVTKQTSRHALPTPRNRCRPAGRGDLVSPPDPRRVGARLPRRPPPPAVPTRAVRRCGPPGWRASVGARRGNRHGDGAAGPGGPERPGGISALRRDIAWKVACGLHLDDEGFHPTVLVYWRNRIRHSARPRRIFEAVRQVVEQTGVLTGRGRRVLDSTIVADAVATQDTVTQLVAAIRRVRRLVLRPVRSSWPPMTMTSPAGPSAPGTTLRPSKRWCRDWSTTRWRCWRRSSIPGWRPSRPRRWRCWRWSPAKTSSPASGQGAGGSPP